MPVQLAFLAKVGGCCLLLTMLGAAQPEPRERRDDNRPGTKAEQPVDREGLKARLQRRLEESKQSVAALESGIKKLDEGGDPAEVARGLERRPGRGDWNRQDGGRPGRPEGFGGGDNSPITAAERESLMAILREAIPSMAEKIESLRTTDPKAAERLAQRMLPKLREAASVRARDPELFQLKIRELKASGEVVAAVQALRQGREKNADLEPLRAALREALSQQFETRQAGQRREITTLETRIAELKAETARKDAERDEMIAAFARKLEEMPERPDRDREGRERPE
ncbi:MAG: hypothetical protein ACOYN0_20180 [Phycisphaerales bacterium]